MTRYLARTLVRAFALGVIVALLAVLFVLGVIFW